MSKKNAATTIAVNNLPKKYYLYINKEYHIKGVSIKGFPIFDKSNCSLFEENQIPFKELDSKYVTVWDPKFKEESNITLRAFVRMPSGMYRHIGNHTESFPTEETVEKAYRYAEEIVKPLIRKTKLLELLSGRSSVGGRFDELKETEGNEFIVKNVLLKKFDYSGKPFYRQTPFKVIFNKLRIDGSKKITLEVPAGTEGIFIGTGGWQVKSWAKLLGVQRIDIVGV